VPGRLGRGGSDLGGADFGRDRLQLGLTSVGRGGSNATRSLSDSKGHDVRVGRPDLNDLVRAAAKGLETAETRRLVVAACGPATLLEAVQKAVAAAQKERRGVRIEFSGSDSRW